jgi:GNAT superfamily N-acetyltransferase
MEGALESLPVTRASADAVADSVARGFHDNELWCWILPDSRRRQRLLSRYYRATVRHIFVPRQTAWTSPDHAGGALWFAPGELSISPLETLRELAVLGSALGVRGMRRALAIEFEKRRHRPSEDHWYLETLSIAPARQRSGVGTALITPVLERCDAEGLPAYLETQRRANIPYYGRFGFSLQGEITALDSPPLWLMWRDPVVRHPNGIKRD